MKGAIRVGRRGFELAACLASGLALAACAASGGAVRIAQDASPSPVVATDPTAQAALERACYGCHASGYGLAGRDRLAFSYWFKGSARRALDFSGWGALSGPEREGKLRAIAKTVHDGDMPPWDARWVDSRAKLSPTERELLAQLGS